MLDTEVIQDEEAIESSAIDFPFEPYWASVPASEIAEHILDKAENYFEHLVATGRMDLYRRSWTYAHRPRLTGGMLNPVGQQGELTSLSVNHFRNLLLHLETMTVQQRPAFEAIAINSDVESLAQADLAIGLIDYYMTEKDMESAIKLAVKSGLIFAESFVQVSWDPNGGEEYGKTATGATIRQGDIAYNNYTPLSCVRDFNREKPGDDDWYILRDFRNKHTLAAKHPAIAKEILDDSDDALEIVRTTTLNFLELEDSDMVAVYKLIHKPTPALPQGRYTEVLGNGTVLLDGPIPYEETHVYRFAPDEEIGTIFGYSVAFDLLPVQEGYDALISAAITNAVNFAVQNILIPKGHDLSTTQIAGGANLMEYDPKIGKPETLQLLQTAPEVYKFMEMLESIMQTISAVNSVARGNPEASLKSGAALALVQSMAIQFSMNMQQSYTKLCEGVGNADISILKSFATVPRVAEIVGKTKRPMMRNFVGTDLNGIKRVRVAMTNPVMKTNAGKTNMADVYLEKGWVRTPEQYSQVQNTGRLDLLTQGIQADLLLIQGENEQLMQGVFQEVLFTDDHAQHIIEHLPVLSSPEARKNPNAPIVVETLAHIQKHFDFAKNPGYAELAQLLNRRVVMPMLPPMGPPVPGAGADATSSQAPSAPPADLPPVNPDPAMGLEMQPNMPNPPQGTDPKSAEIINNL